VKHFCEIFGDDGGDGFGYCGDDGFGYGHGYDSYGDGDSYGFGDGDGCGCGNSYRFSPQWLITNGELVNLGVHREILL
jgi:hypothetical protein